MSDYVAIVSVNAIVHKRLPDGMCHPKAVHSDSFALGCEGESAEECITKLGAKLAELKASWNQKILNESEN